MTKPVVFLSHIHSDQTIANSLESLIRSALLGGVEVFNSSNRKSIAVGEPWRDVIVERLRVSPTILILATPESVSSPWVNFEAGGAWVTGNRVIPCCAKGMTPSSLPVPLSHLQAIDLSSPEDIRSLLKHLADVANLDAPLQLDYQEAVAALMESWQDKEADQSNSKFIQWADKVSKRPKKYSGSASQGIARVDHISAVTPFEANQFRGENIVAGESVECWLSPIGGSTLYHCFANSPVADLIDDNLGAVFEVTVKCLGLMKVYTTDTAWGEEDRGVEYPMAALIVDAKVISVS
jgi:hypothetical protein